MQYKSVEQDTIAAIATPLGVAGISVIRLSGNNAWEIALNIFRTSKNKRPLKYLSNSKIHHGWIINPTNNSLIDEVILLAFKSPNSYTTEDLIEIQCHGGIKVTENILDICLNQGARIAEKGEFTKRAFIGGRIDLTQVEAVLDIISAKTDLFSAAAAYNLSGQLSILINNLRSQLIKLLAQIEASIDFPDDVEEINYFDLNNHLNNIKSNIEEVINKATDGNILKHGIKVVIIGKPNVGKSSLFNHLLNSDRAIVTDIPGTTRDILQEHIDISGIPVVITDTAGIRNTVNLNQNDYIEAIGVNRSKGAIADGDLILFIYDIKQGLTNEDICILDEATKSSKPIIKVANKIDLVDSGKIPSTDIIAVSATSGINIDLLKQKIKNTMLGENFRAERDEVYLNLRHKECLKKAKEYLSLAIEASNKNEMQDLISIDIKSSLISLNEILGEAVTEEILDYIFSQFCIGK
ncbi:MAG: tRNA uridine-5-carboxymethylaminomethyl(34) synthesis GTPase MnmE [Cyanobacteriota bacterium]